MGGRDFRGTTECSIYDFIVSFWVEGWRFKHCVFSCREMGKIPKMVLI